MKKIACLLFALILLMTTCSHLTAFAAGSASITANKSTVPIGETVTITATFNGGDAGIGSLDAELRYNSDTFEYVSCSGATGAIDANSAGRIPISYFSYELEPAKKVTITVIFKAIAAGEGNFEWKSKGVYDDEDNLLDNTSKNLTISANNPTLSGNANLKTMVPSSGALEPKFSPDVTEYTIHVPHSVTRVVFSYTTEDPNATTSIAGKKEMDVGENTRVVTVTAPNGTTKKYTMRIIRATGPSTTTQTTPNATDPSETNPSETTGTVPPPSDNALEVEVNGEHLTILDTQAPIELPEGFAWNTLTINQIEVPAAIHEENGTTLLYLVSSNSQDSGLYSYDAVADVFTRYRPLTMDGGRYLLYDLPEDSTAPAGAVIANLTVKEHNVSAYMYEDSALSDFYIVWAAPVGGAAGWYTYDRHEETLQRYHATPGEATPPTSETPLPSTDKTANVTESPAVKKENTLTAILKNPRNVILFGGVALVAIVIVITVILMVVSLSKPSKGKH